MNNLSFFETTGFSMWPFFKQGRKLIIKKTTVEDLRIGDIILYRSGNQLVCHRLIKKVKLNNEWLLYARGDNSISLPECVNGQMLLGKAIGIMRGAGKTIFLDTRKQQFLNRFIVIIAPFIIRVFKPYYIRFHKFLRR